MNSNYHEEIEALKRELRTELNLLCDELQDLNGWLLEIHDALQQLQREPDTASVGPKLYKPSEVAEMLSVSPSTVRGWVQGGWLKASNVGGQRRRLVIQEDDLTEFLKTRQVQGACSVRRDRARRSTGNWY